MKVLVQYWNCHKGGQEVSISKDEEQIEAMAKRTAPKPDPDFDDVIANWDTAAVPDGKPIEIDIPDDSPFAEMVKSGTIFLHEDEKAIVYDNLPS